MTNNVFVAGGTGRTGRRVAFDGRDASLGTGVRAIPGRVPRDFGDFAAEAAKAGVRS